MLDRISLDQFMLFSPAEIRRQAQQLREKSRHCSDLATSCLTEQGKQVLASMADQYCGEADALERALDTMKQRCVDLPELPEAIAS